MSRQLYPLSSDSESDSEPDESESLNISWKEEKEGGGGHGILALWTSSHRGQGGWGLEKIF